MEFRVWGWGLGLGWGKGDMGDPRRKGPILVGSCRDSLKGGYIGEYIGE